MQLESWQFNPVKIQVSDSVSIDVRESVRVHDVISVTDIEQRLAERNEARRRRDFRKADEIGAFLSPRGISIEDKPDGTTRWKR